MIKLIVGLGNVGQKYSSTRHNVGFIFLDHLAKLKNVSFTFEKKFNSEITDISGVKCIKPHTYMNNSGQAVVAASKYFNILPREILVVHDDLDILPLSYKLKKDAGSAGHNGVIDIIEKLNTQDFWRLRVGIGRPDNPDVLTEKYVLSTLDVQEVSYIHNLCDLYPFETLV